MVPLVPVMVISATLLQPTSKLSSKHLAADVPAYTDTQY